MKVQKVLEFTGILGGGGIEGFAVELMRLLKGKDVHCDFVVCRNIEEEHEKDLEKAQSVKYVIGERLGSQGLRKMKNYAGLLLEHPEYRVIHMHMSRPDKQLQYILISKFFRRKVIAHSHSSSIRGSLKGKKFIYCVLREFLWKLSDEHIACSKKAAQWLYPKRYTDKVTIVHNGIDLEKFLFEPGIRMEFRKKYGIKESDYLLGQVGRLTKEKNHSFSIQILETLIQRHKNVKMLFLGDGEKKEALKKIVREKGLENYVIFERYTDSPQSFYSMMDCCLLPSLFEGYPTAAIEAQVMGLPVFLSDRITKEVAVTNRAFYIPLEVSLWVRAIIEEIEKDRDRKQNGDYTALSSMRCAEFFEELYQRLELRENE